MIKKLLVFLFFIVIIAPSMTSAHTSVVSSFPAEGQLVTEKLQELTVSFDDTIEKMSTMKLLKDGKEQKLQQVQVNGSKIIGKVTEPLEKGNYLVEWQVMGMDGHPIKGKINFQVEWEKMSSNPDEFQTGNEPTIVLEEDTAKSAETKEQPKVLSEKKGEEKKQQPILQPLPLAAIILGSLVGIAYLFKKRK
ncbi:copper resistance CopC family protein [Neobacillus sp. SCS-31]|uniref:copper resistance CopC family protein n=1 Tax=Neobacillus oceani TaxID=3115292 RepID=UPI003905B355